MKIDELMLAPGPSDYYSPSFRNTLESHLALLRASNRTTSVTVDPFYTVVYDQDLFGYLLSLKIPAQLHWLVMRMNNFYSPYDFNKKCTELLVPASSEIESMRISWKTTSVITS